MITFKSKGNTHTVTVKGRSFEFGDFKAAFTFINILHSMAKNGYISLWEK